MKILKYIGIGVGLLILLVLVGNSVPETSVYLGRQIPLKYMEEVKSLGLISENEHIKYFYSDAIFDIKDGMYFVTDKNLVLYNSTWEVPQIIVSFADISSVEVDYDDSFLNDSMVLVGILDGEVTFPLSSEYGRDKKFVEFILTQIQPQ